MIKKIIFVLLSASFTLLRASQAPYLSVNLHPHPVGMFSVFSYVAGILHGYDTHHYSGIEVNFENFGLYYDPEHGPNWWEYYCEPIRLGNQDHAPIKHFDLADYETYAYFLQRHLNREQVYHLIQKYIKIQAPIQKKIDAFVLENFSGHHVISVHYRGTDKIIEAPHVPYHEALESINRYIRQTNLQDYKIFVASDELQFIEFLQKSFANAVITYSTQRSSDGKPLHLKRLNPYLHGEEALIDCILLSKGNVLIRTSSNLSLWSTYFNPSIQTIALSERY